LAGKDPSVPENRTGQDSGHEQSLSELLASARESRQLSPAQAAAEAHVPAHYVKMLEAGDYSLISDQLYLLPFLRRYASFLALDADEVAMRFVRDTQGAESYPVRAAEPAPAAPTKNRKRGGWLTSVAVALIVLLALYLAGIGRRHAAAHDDTSDAPAAVKPNS
jgi:cytoskeletal protein RodZ